MLDPDNLDKRICLLGLHLGYRELEETNVAFIRRGSDPLNNGGDEEGEERRQLQEYE